MIELGDLQPDWTSDDGNVVLFNADCMDVLPQLPEGCVDAVVTDPPYSSGGAFRGDRMATTRDKYQSSGVRVEHHNFSGDNRDQRGWVMWMTLWLAAVQPKIQPGGAVCLFTDWRQLPSTTDAIQCGGYVWRGIVPWDKCNARPVPDRFSAQCEYVVWGSNGPRRASTKDDPAYLPGIVRQSPPTGANREHSTQKPDGIIGTLCGIARGELPILDPFLGSGTTAVACVNTGRKCIGIEKEPKYFDIAVERVKKAYADRGLYAEAAP